MRQWANKTLRIPKKGIDMDLQPAQTMHGFTVRTAEDLPEIDGRAYVFDHASTGAQLLYLRNDDSNKAFSIAFKTPPKDDTGVFHILEHSVLCGSGKFPVKEPFVNLLKSSMQTFLNAMTYPDKTVYPVASTSEQDLLNLMDVYLDAVFHPAIYSKRTIFEQEGWHIETVADKDAASDSTALAYNGVVYNEMKGALSDPESVLYDELSAALFPDTAYRFESGGKPSAIPTLSYEDFLDTHRRHYNAANAKIVLYGDMDIDRFLAFVDERLRNVSPANDGEAAPREPNPLALQAPVRSFGNRKKMKTAPENACCAVGYVIGEARDRERMLAADVLLDAIMGSNEAPVKRALLDAGLADDVQAYVADAMLQPFAVVQLRGIDGEAAQKLRPAFEGAVRTLADGALDRGIVEAALSHAEFLLRERNFGMADGVMFACSCMASWLYHDDAPCDYLRYEQAFKNLRAKLDEGYFEQLLRELFLENDHAASAEIVPAEDAGEKSEADSRIESLAHTLDEAGRQEIEHEVEKLRRAQETPDSPEALASLPRMRPSDIDDAPAEPAYALDDEGPVPCLRHDVATHGIVYAYRYFGLDRLSFEELPYATVLAMLLGKLATDAHTATEIDTLAQSKLGNLSLFTEVHEHATDRDTLFPTMTLSASALSANAEWAASLPTEILLSTDFSDAGKIKDVLIQKRVAMEQGFANAGHSAAMAHAASYYLPAAVVREQLGGVGFYRFLKRLIDNYDEEKDALAEKLDDIARRIFVDDNCLLSYSGDDADLARAAASGMILERSSADGDAKRLLVVPQPRIPESPEAFVVPTDVTYAAQGYDRRLLDAPYSGAWLVASRALSYDYLWNEVRVKGGAYGAGFSTTRPGNMRFYSYRDPHLDETLARFAAAGSWLGKFDPTEAEMDGYVVSTVAGIDSPVKPRELARRQDGQFISKLSPDARAKVREETVRTTPAEVRALGSAVSACAEKRAVCVFGNREIIEEAKTDFTVIDLLKE